MSVQTIEVPSEVLWALEQDPDEFESEARLLLAVKLYEMGRLSTGLAARLAGVPRITFMFLLGQHGLSPFGETPDETLAEVALLLEEMSIGAGQTLFEKGDLGDCLYIIVDGEVRVHDGERTLNHLHAGDIFGEMAILDAEPRVASVTGVVDTQLLRLDQEPFYELMDDRSEVARGIILVLSRHLRDRVQDLNELRARFEAAKASE